MLISGLEVRTGVCFPAHVIVIMEQEHGCVLCAERAEETKVCKSNFLVWIHLLNACCQEDAHATSGYRQAGNTDE